MTKKCLRPINITDPVPFKINTLPVGASAAEVIFGSGARVVHPCTVFAKSAGYESWAQAVEAMRAGVIVQGQGPRIGKTTIDVDLFNKEVADAGLTAKYSELGLVAVGLPGRLN